MMNETSDAITLRLEGARAKRGVVLADFETFIDSFLAALRDFDRSRRGAPTKTGGRPEARAEAVTSFRLVGFREGSGIVMIEPELAAQGEETETMLDAEPAQLTNLRALLASLETEEPLAEPITGALEKAIRTAGDDGSLSIELPRRDRENEPPRPVVIDAERIARIRDTSQAPPPTPVTSISGRLHRVDFEPDNLAIRASDGVDWVCSYPEELEQRVETLVNKFVWASGTGTLQSPRRGTMALDSIKAVEQGVQTGLFSGEPVPDEELASAQGIVGPQGLDAIGVAAWSETDDAYLAALTED